VRPGSKEAEGDFEALVSACGALGLGLAPERVEQLRWYRAEIARWNRRVNLVSRRDIERLVSYHFLDSVEGLGHVRATDRRILDLGSGAGLPGLVWKIVRPELDLVLVESVRKRGLFLRHVVAELGLERIAVVESRGETLAKDGDFVGRFHLAVARTVANLSRLVEICLPLVATGGRLLAYKGARLEGEVDEAAAALDRCGGRVVGVMPASSETLGGKRRFVLVEKRSQ